MKSKILDECLRIARKYNPKHPEIEGKGYLHYSFIVQGDRIVEWATNKKAAPQIWHGYPVTSKLHSEFLALRRARGILEKNVSFEIVNIRLNKKGDLRSSYPCKHCYTFLVAFGCKEIWFTTNLGFAKVVR
jgi:hypothetical protein